MEFNNFDTVQIITNYYNGSSTYRCGLLTNLEERNGNIIYAGTLNSNMSSFVFGKEFIKPNAVLELKKGENWHKGFESIEIFQTRIVLLEKKDYKTKLSMNSKGQYLITFLDGKIKLQND